MRSKKVMESKCVHKFTESAFMKFRPIHYELPPPPLARVGVVQRVSSMFKNFINHLSPTHVNTPAVPTSPKRTLNKTKSAVNITADKKTSQLKQSGQNVSKTENESVIRQVRQRRTQLQRRFTCNFPADDDESSKILAFLQKISADTFLIGNQYQVDVITISGIYENCIDTDLNWSLNVQKKIKRLSVDTKRGLLALECLEEVLFYRFNTKKLKQQPVLVARTRLLGQPKFMLFLKEGQLGVFYAENANVYQIDENNNIRLVFNKKYGVRGELELFQIPKPIDNTLNIFFKEKSSTARTSILWRLVLDFKDLSSTNGFNSLLRIYDIPNDLVSKFRIDNYSKDVFIMNFKFEILAAKDGYIIDSANTNIQEQGACLVYIGEHLLHVCDEKLYIYSFRIITSSKPNKVDIRSIDSIDILKGHQYAFFDCLEMLNQNFVLFFQLRPEFNNKVKGEITYMIKATQKLSIHEKLKEIFSFKSPEELKNMAQNNFAVIQQKCDTAFKIGLTHREVYLQLWNKSNKSDIQDYKFLLDTMDYDTIKMEVEKKLKKSSMSFNEVYKLEQGCFDMLKVDLFSKQGCSEKNITNYLISHFLLRKLAFFRDRNLMSVISSDEVKPFMIQIHEYLQCTRMELKTFLLDYVFKICFQEKDSYQYTRELRLFIRAFKFPLRVIYLPILEEIIIQCKNKLIDFLVALPEILPFTHLDIPDGDDLGLYEGMWSEIGKEEWHNNMHLEQITTIYNKESLQQFLKTVWFRMNQFSLHDLIAHSTQKIVELQKFNRSEGVFYYFIEKIFQHNRDEANLIEVVDFLELNYEQMPAHLKGKIFLYRKLYSYFLKQRCSGSNLESFTAFLKLKDYEMFKELFKYEKIKKGCLLKDAKTIYNSVPNGHELYNEALLNYFASDISQISDLKSILNRLNNEKREFHVENEDIYGMLVRGMQMKLKLGSAHDIPFDEVMIYFENIPLSKDSPVIQELNIVQQIGEQSERFKRMNLNMSFHEIIERFQDVLTAMISYEINEKEVMAIRDVEMLKAVTYQILAQVQNVKEKIYKYKMNSLGYFIYISKLMEEKELIPHAAILLKDPSLLDFYLVDEKIIQNLVIYMYRWRLTKQPAFIQNQDYLWEILSLLPEDNKYRMYFTAEIQFSIMLSTTNKPIQFRPSDDDTEGQPRNESVVTTKYVTEIVNDLPLQLLAKLDLGRLHELISTMQQLTFQEQVYLGRTTQMDILQVVILRLITLKAVRQALPLVRRLIGLYGDQQHYSIVYCFIILNIILCEVSQNHKRSVFKLAFYTFHRPMQLLDIIQERIENKFSNNEEEVFINKQLQLVGQNRCYSKDNFLLEGQFLEKIMEKEDKFAHKFEELIFQTWMHLNNNREDFAKNYEYTFVYICLLHNPYALAKYLQIRHESINVRILRSYLSYVFKEEIFDGLKVLYFSKRMFTALLDSLLEGVSIETVINRFRGVELEDDIVEILEIEETNLFAIKLKKSIQAFSSKLESLRNKEPVPGEVDKKRKRVQDLLSSQASIKEGSVSDYPFDDSDDNYEEKKVAEAEEGDFVVRVTKVKKNRVFNANKERANLLSRDKNSLFMTTVGLDRGDIRKSTPGKNFLQSSRSFQKEFKSLRITTRLQKQTSDYTHSREGSSNKQDQINIQKGDYELELQREGQLAISRTHEDFLVTSLNPNYNRPRNLQLDSYNAAHLQYQLNSIEDCDSPIQIHIPKKKTLFGLDNQGDALDNSYQYEEEEQQFNVKVNQINDQEFTPVFEIRKKLIEEYGGSDSEPMFNLAVLQNEEAKQFNGFQTYLKQVIVSVYECEQKPLSFLLSLIKAIRSAYPRLPISGEFLENYILLQNYNIKYKYSLPIREMFPIHGIFQPSKDPRVLFAYAKEHLLQYVDFDNIMIVAKLLHFALKRSQIKDELFFSYLATAIQHYGNDSESSEQEIVMQRQRIGGIIDQITMPSLFVEKGQALLRPVSIEVRRQEVLQLVKQAFKKKKKEDLIVELEKRLLR